MQSQSHLHLPLTIRLAHAINRLLTWGMTAEERRQFLSESLADWEAMAHERPPQHVLWRAIRGIPAAIWIRLSDRDITAMPAGVALTLVGIGGIASGTLSSNFPSPFREYVVVTSVGLVLVGVNFIRDPRQLVLRRYRLAGLVVATGFAGLAAYIPTAAEWPYDGPVLENRVIDTAMQASFVIIAVGFVLLVTASFIRTSARLVSATGIVLVVGVATLGVTQVSWAIAMAPIDLRLTSACVVIGLAALSFAHVLPRLRHLDIAGSKDTYSKDKDVTRPKGKPAPTITYGREHRET